MPPISDHPLRRVLSDEVHTRPFLSLVSPERVSHLAIMWGPGGEAADRAQVAALCGRFGVQPPGPGDNHLMADLGPFCLKWERHSEFGSYTFIVRGAFDEPFAEPAICSVPGDWLEALEGEIIAAVHVDLQPGPALAGNMDTLKKYIEGTPVVGASVVGGGGEVWTDFRIGADGFSRFLVRDIRMRPGQAGRLTQRLLEVETYRVLALLALPLARTAGPVVGQADRELAGITGEMAGIEGLEQERGLLDRLTRVAAEIEGLSAANNYRFGASAAYYRLVNQRIVEIRETRIEGVQTIGEFMDRRLAPAMATCVSLAGRQDELSERISRVSQLLRTRVDIALEGQNRDLLRSMNRRAQLQLRLQETVEGLSVVVISYYTLSLAAYAFKGLKAAGVPIDVDIAAGLTIPVVIGLVWAGVRRLRRAILRESESGERRD